MSEWLSLLVLLVAASMILFVPGLLVAFALRLRGILLWGAAPAVSVGLLGTAAIVLSMIGVRWSLVSVSIVILVATIVAFGIGRLFRGGSPKASKSRQHGLVIAVVVALIVSISRLGLMIGGPANISQTNDAIFHLNALRYIDVTGSASSFTVAGTLGSSSFYPSGWHAAASLVATLPGSDSVIAANAMSLAIAGPVWTVGITAFAWSIWRRRLVAVYAALFSPTLFAFPFLMLDFGVLYPYALSVAVLPGVLALAVAPTVHRAALARGRVWWQHGLITAAGLVGIALAQPVVLQIWLLAAVCLLTFQVLSTWRTLEHRRRLAAFASVILAMTLLIVVWKVLAGATSGNQWRPLRTAWVAVPEALINSPAGGPAAFVVSVLSVVGAICIARQPKQRWLLIFWIALTFLALVAVSVRNVDIREFLLAGWYGDPYRLLALLPLVVIPSAALGLDRIVRRFALREVRRGARSDSGGRFKPVAIVILIVVFLEAATWSVIDRMFNADSYSESDTSYLSTDERTLLVKLPELVEDDARVLGNPSSGAAFGYGLSGVDVFPRTWAMPGDNDFQLLRFELNEAGSDPAVCAAVDRLRIDYVLDFGVGQESPGRWLMPGLTGFEGKPGFELVAAEGEASLWRITACDA